MTFVPRTAACLSSRNERIDAESETFIAHTLRAEGFDASEDGTGRGTPLVPVAYRTSGNCVAWETGDRVDALTTNTDPNSSVVAFSCKDHGADAGELSPTLRAGVHKHSHANAGVPPAVFQTRIARNGRGQPKDTVDALTSSEGGSHADSKPHVFGAGHGVRRLTPRECERLMSWPDDWTAHGIDEKGNTVTMADGPRYRMCGNGVVSNVAEWIARRLMTLE